MTTVDWHRRGAKWTEYEDELLLRLFAEAEAHPDRQYMYGGRWRKNPVYFVASKLGRTPCSVSSRRYTLLVCAKRCASNQTEGRKIVLGKQVSP